MPASQDSFLRMTRNYIILYSFSYKYVSKSIPIYYYFQTTTGNWVFGSKSYAELMTDVFEYPFSVSGAPSSLSETRILRTIQGRQIKIKIRWTRGEYPSRFHAIKLRDCSSRVHFSRARESVLKWMRREGNEKKKKKKKKLNCHDEKHTCGDSN